MKTIYLFLFVLLVTNFSAFAQENNIETGLKIKKKQSVRMVSEEVQLSFDKSENSKKINWVSVEEAKKGLIKFSEATIEIKSGDLILSFFMPEKKTGYFFVELNKITNSGENIPVLPERIYLDILKKPNEDGKFNNGLSLKLSNAEDNFNPIYLTGNTKFEVTVSHFDYESHDVKYGFKIQCDGKGIDKLKLHKFGYQKGIAPNILVGVGAGLAYWHSLNLLEDSDDAYNDKYVLNETRIGAEEDYQEANNLRKKSRGWYKTSVITGATVLVWTFVQYHIKIERRKTYECKCQSICIANHSKEQIKIEFFNPSFNAENQYMIGYTGVGLRLNF